MACIRWPQRAEDAHFIQSLSLRSIDWKHFVLLVQHHRVVPIVLHNLVNAHINTSSIEIKDAFATLREIAAANTRSALRSLSELRSLCNRLNARGIPVRILKGLPLAQEIFGDLSFRMTGDIDVLVDASHILKADEVLRESGYQGLVQIHRFSQRRFSFYRAHWKDIAYKDLQRGHEVDLHWRLFRNRQMPGGDLIQTAERCVVAFGDFHVNTLPKEEHLLYLCIHGTIDGWLYLKSLADIAALVRTMSPSELDSLAAKAIAYKILPELSVAMILVRRFFGMDNWSSAFLPDNSLIVRHSLLYAEHALVGGAFVANRVDISSARVFAFEYGLRRNFSYRKELFIRILFRLRMWTTFPLPDYLFGLYPLLSPIEWLFSRIRSKQDERFDSSAPTPNS